jgi:hypothetical protein
VRPAAASWEQQALSSAAWRVTAWCFLNRPYLTQLWQFEHVLRRIRYHLCCEAALLGAAGAAARHQPRAAHGGGGGGVAGELGRRPVAVGPHESIVNLKGVEARAEVHVMNDGRGPLLSFRQIKHGHRPRSPPQEGGALAETGGGGDGEADLGLGLGTLGMDDY